MVSILQKIPFGIVTIPLDPILSCTWLELVHSAIIKANNKNKFNNKYLA